jgi:thiosulfate dehydrogenase [quinone] large subunit
MTVNIIKEREMAVERASWRETTDDFRPRSFHIMFFILRIVLGGMMLEAGLDKAIGGFSMAGYVSHGSGPFASWFAHMASASAALSPLVMTGEILIGLALIFGILLRFGSFWGAVLMILYYLPYLPPENGWISKQIIYLLVFVTLMFSRSGYFLGIDRFFTGLEEKWPGLRILLG